ncbi:hypothetical protein [Pseudomonas sp. NPDC099000]|uniref:hypothetical protein n=1 Tax=Pseudomonas sp. NPDC099000 TaxID=3364488 RepID=UPI00383BAC20
MPTDTTDPVARMQQITADDPEWSAVRAGFDCVEAMAEHANEALGAPVWAGYALRAAFVAGAKWQREQDDAAAQGEAPAAAESN